MRKRLSSRAEILLGVVREASVDGRCWVPTDKRQYKVYGIAQGDFGVAVNGSGDASILRMLERRGLIALRALAAYAYATTDAGEREYDKIAARLRSPEPS